MMAFYRSLLTKINIQKTRLSAYLAVRPRKRLLFRISLAAIAILLVLLVWVTIFKGDKKEVTTNTPKPVATVQITSNGFVPATLSITPGTKVVWTNTEEALHRIAANPHPTRDSLPSLYSEILNKDHTYEYTFNNKGTFSYHDEQIPTLNGVIQVQ
jgi:plastocyanin